MKHSKQDVTEARERLLTQLKPGDTVYTILRHVSRSGMQREIGVVVMREGQPLHPNYAVAALLGLSVNKQGDGVVIGGAGMDMGFEVVYLLSRSLFNGYCDGAPHGKRARHTPHSNNGPACEYRDGGYALRQRWL